MEQGDWYARNMYIQGSRQYNYHVAHYGHPSKVGFKDLCPLWKAAEFDPDHLMELYKRAGAKYFVSMGVHHDNFDLWNSKHTRWNAVKVGPHKDVVGLWRTAALKRGLRFGVSEHLWISYKWFAVSHGSDKAGPLAGLECTSLYVRAGSILPRGPEIEYADEKPAGPIELRICPGAYGKFELYQDAGDSYDYKKGAHSLIPIHWSESTRSLMIGGREGSYPEMPTSMQIKVIWVSVGHGPGVTTVANPDEIIEHTGKALSILAP